MITYALGRGLYVALTNRANTTPLFNTRGPGFKITSTQFEPLPEGIEPETQQVLAAVGSALALTLGPAKYDSIVFAGFGEPTLRLGSLLEVCQGLKAGVAKDIPLRLSTNGLGNVLHGRDLIPELAASGIMGVTVALNTGLYGSQRLLRGTCAHLYIYICICTGLALFTPNCLRT